MLFDALLKPARAVHAMRADGRTVRLRVENKPPAQPSFYDSMAKPDVQLDANAAASMISGYRRNNGLDPVSLDPQLMQLAETQAQSMAGRDKLDHNVGGVLARAGQALRLRGQGRRSRTSPPAITRWPRRSRDGAIRPRIGPICSKTGVTKMGIAAVYAPGSKYRVFWALVLASPDDKRK